MNSKQLNGLILCLGLFPAASHTAENLPLPPLLERDVHLVNTGKLTRPAIPANRVSNDGRISLDFSSVTQVEFTLIKPESLDRPFDQSEPGYHIIGTGGLRAAPFNSLSARNRVAPFNVDRDLFHDSTHNSFGDASHHTICDATSDKYLRNEQHARDRRHTYGTKNPYPCADDPKADCYDLTMIATHKVTGGIQLWGTPFTVKVKSPKTRWAQIESVKVGTPVAGNTFSQINFWAEPLTTGDGRLIIGRVEFESMFYSVANLTDPPCDVTKWTSIHEITHAHHDPAMFHSGRVREPEFARYGIARYPMKDGVGNVIPDNASAKFTYPWIDKAGANIFFEAVDATLFYKNGAWTGARYTTSCYKPGCTLSPTNIEEVDTLKNLRGIGVFGTWTHGKMLLVDNLSNNIDYGTGWGDNEQFYITLYDGLGADAKVRIGGAGWPTSSIPSPGGLPLASTPPYFYIIDSVEHLFNNNPNLNPNTIRNAVWYLNMSKVTDKVVFDEWLNPDTVVFAEWIPALVHTDGSGAAAPTKRMHYRDGFISGKDESWDGTGFGEEIWFQNGATGVKWKVPAYGLTYQAEKVIRAEPVAQGGIKGRGLWLFGKNNVTFKMPAQADHPTEAGKKYPAVDGQSWYVGLYVDAAATSNDTVSRRLLTFPDGSFIALKGRKVEVWHNKDTLLHSFTLHGGISEKRQWRHLGFRFHDGGSRIDFLLNGFKLSSYAADSTDKRRVGRMLEGAFILGRPLDRQATGQSANPGYEGWTDSLLVIAQDAIPELACNYANGTLVGLASGYAGPLKAQADLYPQSAHDEITLALTNSNKQTYAKYACLHDYTTDLEPDPRHLPRNVASVREDLTHPEGDPVWGSPVRKPHSLNNAFCLSCHYTPPTGAEIDSFLTRSKLGGGYSAEEATPRRPSDGPRVIHGNIPASHFGVNLPPADTVAPLNGANADQWTRASGRVLVDPDADDDFDGVRNFDDAFPADANRSLDSDGDRIDDWLDPDIDGDGVGNDDDAFPLDPREWADTDGDGQGDNADVDRNNDGVMDPIRATFDAPGPRLTVSTPLNAEWRLIDPRQAGLGDHYAGGYTIKREWAGVPDTGIEHAMLQGGFSASVSFARVGDSRGSAMINWRFDDSGSQMQVEYHTDSSTLVAAVRKPQSDRLVSFGSRALSLPKAALNAARRLRVDVHWTPSDDGGPGSGTWYVAAGLDNEELSVLGTTEVSTSPNSSDTRTMSFLIEGNTTEYVWIDYLTLDPVGGIVDPTPDGQVCFYDRADWVVNDDSFRACIGESAHNFNSDHNDKVSAVSVGDGVYAFLYEHVDWTGRSTCIESNTNLFDLGVLDNIASSFKVGRGLCSPILTFVSPASFSVPENQTDVGSVTARDTNDEITGYQISGGVDSAAFSIGPDGLLSFVEAPNHESPSDSGEDNVYEVVITATRGTGDLARSAEQSVSVTVTDIDESPDALAAPSVGEIGKVSVKIAWQAPSDAVPPITGFRIRYRESACDTCDWIERSTSGNDNNFNITRLVAGTAYEVGVAAVNEQGPGPFSPSAVVTTIGSASANEACFYSRRMWRSESLNSLLICSGIASENFQAEMKNRVEAVSVGTGVHAIIYDEPTLSGELENAKCIPGGTDDDHDLGVLHGDADSFKVASGNDCPVPVFPTPDGQACFYSEPNWSLWRAADGSSTSPWGWCSAAGNFDIGVFQNDGVSAVSVGAGVHAILFSEPGLEGATICVPGGVTNNALGELDNDASSVKIRSGDVCPDSPEFVSPAAYSVAENQTAVGTVLADDPYEKVEFTVFSITGGKDDFDHFLFSITDSGVLAFAEAPNFELPDDSDGDNVYEVEITATSADGSQSGVQTIQVTVTDVAEVPAAPARLRVDALGSTSSLKVVWDGPLRGDPQVDAYEVRYRIFGEDSADWNDDDVTYFQDDLYAVISELVSNTKYEMQVRGVNATGNGNWSISATGQTAQRRLFFNGSKFAGLLSLDLDVGIAVNVELPQAEGGDGTVEYTFARADAGGLPAGLAFDSTTRVLSGTPTAAEDNSSYTYTATDADGSTATESIQISVAADTAPVFSASRPDLDTAAGKWVSEPLPNASNGNGALTFELLKRGTDLPFAENGLSFDGATRVLSGTPTLRATYALTYRVQDSDTNQSDADAAAIEFELDVFDGLSEPQRVAASPGDSQVTLSWLLPINTGLSAVTGYDVRAGAIPTKPSTELSSAWTPVAASTTEFTFTGLENGVELQFEVRARNSAGAGPIAFVRSTPAVPANRPPAFTNIPEQVEVEENTSIVLTLVADDPDEGDAVTGYGISGGADSALFSVTNGGVLSFIAPPDYENPQDADENNNYLVDVTVASGEGDRAASASHSMTVAVTDVADGVAAAGEVCFYESATWLVRGVSVRGGALFRACIGVSAYNFNDQHNDRVSAVAVGTGVHAIIYADKGYQGDSMCIDSGTNVNDLGALDNAASSFKVVAGGCPK